MYSKIDSDRFGVKVGRVGNDFDISAFKDFDLVIARISLDRIDLINRLERYGFVVGDVQTTYRHYLGGEFVTPTGIRRFDVSDIDDLVKITRDSFYGYPSHYFNDYKLSPKDCVDAYTDWVYNICTNNELADKIFVSEIDGLVAGYFAIKMYHQNKHQYSAGVLGAVGLEHRRKGVFQNLAIATLNWSKENGCEWSENNVLINNYPVIRVYSKMGYVPYRSEITLHGWTKTK